MKDKKIILAGMVVLLLVAGIGGLVSSKYVKREEKKETDAIRFKKEYEKLNGTIRESDGARYNDVDIPEDNPIKYVDAKGALEVLKNETAILYVGAEWCPWCRNSVPVLLDVARNRRVDVIYYLNLDNEKDVYEVVDDKLVKTKEGTEAYYDLLDYLKDYLRDYTLKDSKGKDLNTGEKRIFLPFFIGARGGVVVDTKSSSIKLDEGQTKYDKLTEKQYKTVYDNYLDLFKKVFTNSTCDDDCN